MEGAQWPLLLRLKSLASPHTLRSSAPVTGHVCPALCSARSQAPPEEKTSLCYPWTVTSKEPLLLLWGSMEPVRKPHWVWKLPGPLPTVSFTLCQVLNYRHFPESRVLVTTQWNSYSFLQFTDQKLRFEEDKAFAQGHTAEKLIYDNAGIQTHALSTILPCSPKQKGLKLCFYPSCTLYKWHS